MNWNPIPSLPARLGKRIGRSVWVHSSALPPEWVASVVADGYFRSHCAQADIVVRFDHDRRRYAVLHYPGFERCGHPALCCSTLMDAETGASRRRSFANQANRPILHRKELIAGPEHPHYNEFAALTAAEEQLGLLKDKRRIGWSQYWNALLAESGIRIKGHRIIERRASD